MNTVEYKDGFDYEQIQNPLFSESPTTKIDLESLLEDYGFSENLKNELVDELQQHIHNEIKSATLEFVNRFFEKLGRGSKLAYCVSRALGFKVFMKDKDGNEIHSLNEIAKYWNCSPQLIDQLSKQIKEDIDVDPIQNLGIEKKNYSYKVTAPEGYMTTGQVIKFLNISNKKLNSIIKRLKINKKDYIRGSKIISEEDLDRVELWLMTGSDNG